MKLFYYCLVIVIPILAMSCRTKGKNLTGGTCKYWNSLYLERNGVKEINKKVSFKICKNNYIEWFKLSKDGSRKKLYYGDVIPDFSWSLKGDSLITYSDNFKIIYLTEDSLVMQNKRIIIHLKSNGR